jgi:hypothetical protein
MYIFLITGQVQLPGLEIIELNLFIIIVKTLQDTRASQPNTAQRSLNSQVRSYAGGRSHPSLWIPYHYFYELFV